MSDDQKKEPETQSWEGPEIELPEVLVPGVPWLFQATKIGGERVVPSESKQEPSAGSTEFPMRIRSKSD